MTPPVLVDRAVDVAPPAGDLHVGLVQSPAGTDGVSARPGGVSQQRREPQHPAVDGEVVDLNAALGQQFLNVAIGQAEAQVPAHRPHDHIGREAEASEGGAGDGSGFSCRQSRCSKAVAANATAPANEGDTRLLVTDFLCDALGFDKYADLTTEYQVKGEFADYGVRIDRELMAFIEVKRIATKLAPKHLRQVERCTRSTRAWNGRC
jgi:hypothetical protein